MQLTIPDMIHVCAYPQELMRAKGLKEQRIANIRIPTDNYNTIQYEANNLHTIYSADIQGCYLAKRLI